MVDTHTRGISTFLNDKINARQLFKNVESIPRERYVIIWTHDSDNTTGDDKLDRQLTEVNYPVFVVAFPTLRL